MAVTTIYLVVLASLSSTENDGEFIMLNGVIICELFLRAINIIFPYGMEWSVLLIAIVCILYVLYSCE